MCLPNDEKIVRSSCAVVTHNAMHRTHPKNTCEVIETENKCTYNRLKLESEFQGLVFEVA